MKAYRTLCSTLDKSSAVAEMGDHARAKWVGRWGLLCPFLWGGRLCWVPIKHNVAWAEAYMHAKFRLDLSNRLATMHQRHRGTDRTTVPIA